MRIAVLCERKAGERRVAVTPEAVVALVKEVFTDVWTIRTNVNVPDK